MQRMFLVFLALLFSAGSHQLLSADFYWDSNGTTPGAGLTPTGIWGTSAFWSPDSTGASATGAWVAGSGAIFSAGTDATSLFVVTINTAQTANLLTIEEGIVSFEGSNTVTLGAGPITVAPGATLSTNSNLRIATTAGSILTLNGSTLQTTNSGPAGTFFDTDTELSLGVNGGTFSHTTANILNIVQTASRITGPGSLTKTGAGVLAIASTAGNNTYAGATIVNDGELRIRTVVNTLPITTPLIVNAPGIFNLNGVSQQVGSLTGNGLVGLANGTLTVGNGDSTIYTGSIRDTANAGAAGSTSVGGSVTKVGSGTLAFTGVNTFTGTFTLNGGSVTVDPGAALSGPTANLTVTSGTLNLNNGAQTVKNLAGAAAGTIVLPAGYVLTTDPIANSTCTAAITGPGALTKLNVLSGATNRTLTLNGANTYEGVTTISGGILSVGSATALGSTIGNTEVASGAELLFTGVAINFNVAEPLRIAGIGNTNAGAIAVIASATPTLSGPITLTGDTTITVSGASAVTISNPAAITSLANQNLTLQGGSGAGVGGTITGVISLGAGNLTKLQGGRWILAGANTYTGTTSINSGTLQVAAPEIPAVSGPLGVGGTISFVGGALQFSAANTFDYSSRFSTAPTQIYRFDTNGTTVSFAANLSSLAGSLTKLGTGTLILTNANTYDGVTVVNAGTLRAANATGSATGSNTVTVNAGARLDGTGVIAGLISVDAGGALAGGNGNTGTLTVNSLNFATGAVLALRITDGTNIAGTLGGSTTGTPPATTSNTFIEKLGGTLAGLDQVNVSVDLTGTTFTLGSTYSYAVGRGFGDQTALNINADARFTFVGGEALPGGTLLNGDQFGFIYLTFTPIPEPGLMLCLSGMIFGFVSLSRKTRQNS